MELFQFVTSQNPPQTKIYTSKYHYRDKFPIKETILIEQEVIDNYNSDLSLEIDDNLDEENEQFENASTTMEDSLLMPVE